MATSDTDILKDAAERRAEAVEGWSFTWEEGRAAREFVDDPSSQWPADIAMKRKMRRQPCLVVPILPTMLLQVENEALQNLPSMKVSPVDNRADVETANILQGILRHSEQRSRADIAYATGFRHCLKMGFGFFRLYTEKANPWSDDQEVVIKRVADPFRVLFDPFFQEPDGADAEYAFYSEDVSHERFKALYPTCDVPGEGTDGDGGLYPSWVQPQGCTIREYWQRGSKTVKVVVLSDGSTYDVGTVDESWLATSGLQVHEITDAEIPVVRWYKLTAADVLDRSEWELEWLPIIPVLGRELTVNGKRLYVGLVRDGMDPSRAINYLTSAETEVLALAPKNPYIAAAGQIEEYADEWKNANREPQSVLRYKPLTNGGQPVPPPQRQMFDVAIQGIMQALAQAHDDLRAIIGVYPAQAGAPSNETSAAAIERRLLQGQTTNAHYKNGLFLSVRQGCRVALQLIRQTYDGERIARIIGEDGQAQQVPVNQPFTDMNGVQRVYDLTAGQYDVIPGSGPSFESRREEARAAMQEFVKQNPQQGALVMDLIATYSDWPGKEQFAERFRKMLPPPLQEGGPTPAEQEKDQQIAELSQKVQELSGGIEEAKIKAAADERVEIIKQETAVLVAQTKATSDEAVQEMQRQLAWLRDRVSQWDTALTDEELTPGMPAPDRVGAPNGGAGPGGLDEG